jgi:hypothetical protein
MSVRRRVVLTVLCVIGVTHSVTWDLAAQQAQQTRATSVLVPIFGAGDAGASLEGTLLIQRFTTRGNEIVAEGTLNGALRDLNGGVRNIVTPISMPLDVNAGVASRDADVTVPQDSCEVLRLVLGTSTLNLPGSTVALGSVLFDLSSAVQPSTGATAPTTPSGASSSSAGANTSTASNRGISSPDDDEQPTMSSPGRIGTAQPGVISTPPGAAADDSAVGAQPINDVSNRLPELLCSAASLQRTNGSRAELARALNQVLAALDR